MVAITFPLSTSPGAEPQEGAGRLINCFAEPRGEGLGPVYHRAPGSQRFAAITETGFRGAIQVGTTLYAVYEDVAVKVTSSGGVSALGSFPGTDKVFLARNNNSTPDIVGVSTEGAFSISSSTVIPFADSDVGSPACVCSFDGWFMFGYGNGDVQASDLNSVNINTLNAARAESNPDGIIRDWQYGRELYLAGTASIEVWGYPANPSGFPLNRQAVINPGIAGKYCVAGFEPEFGNPPLYVASDNTVRQLSGYSPQKVSPPDLDRLISAVDDKDTLEACCYISDGHPFWQISSPSWTWVFNLNNAKWHERKSYGLDNARISLSGPAFDMWICGDTQNGNLYQITGEEKTEDGQPLVCIAESVPADAFPASVAVSRASFKFVPGVGITTGEDPIETDPTFDISWSNDGGYTWTVPQQRALGRQGETRTRVDVWRCGMSGELGRRWRISLSDPVHFGLMGGDMAASATQ